MKNYYFKFLAVILSAVMVFGTVSVFWNLRIQNLSLRNYRRIF